MNNFIKERNQAFEEAVVYDEWGKVKMNRSETPEQLTLSGNFDEEMAKKIKKAMRHCILEPVEENKWIKCSDRMPEEDKEVLFVRKTWGKNKEIYIGVFDSKMKWWQAGSGVIKNEYVTHWMPLPEPPEGKEK